VRAVLDSSVLIAAFLSAAGASRVLVRHAQTRTFLLVLSDAIIVEVQRNLLRLGVPARTATRYLRVLRKFSLIVHPVSIPRVIHDHPPDDAILACAHAGRADVLVTLDRRHLLPLKTYRGVTILLPGDFLKDLPELPES